MRAATVLVCLAIMSVCTLEAQQQTSPDGRSRITVNGESVVYVQPDQIEVALGIETRDLDIMSAKQKNSDILKKAIAAIKESGISEKDIQTDHLSIEPRYRSEYEKETFLGYLVRNTLIVTLNDTSNVEELLSKVLQAGVNYIHGVNFQTTALRKYRDQARESALKAAKEKAEAMSRVLGQSLGAPIQINENNSGWSYYSSWSGWGYGRSQPLTQNSIQYAPSGSVESSDTIALGKIAARANVTVVFELQK